MESEHFFPSKVQILFFVSLQLKSTPQLTPRKFLNLPDQRSSLMFESCDAISITSLGKKCDFTCPHFHFQMIRQKKPCECLFIDAGLCFTHAFFCFFKYLLRVRGRFVLRCSQLPHWWSTLLSWQSTAATLRRLTQKKKSCQGRDSKEHDWLYHEICNKHGIEK